MISPQARIIKRIMALKKRRIIHVSGLEKERREFERNMRLLFPAISGKFIQRRTIGGVVVEQIQSFDRTDLTIIYVHGGGFTLGSSRAYRQHLVRLARLCRAKVVSVEYSLAPEYPYPHAVNQIYRVWHALSKHKNFNPLRTVFMGDSAGANLVLATVLRLKSENLQLPACLVLLSPGLDATFTGESYIINKEKDVILSLDTIEFYMKAYVQKYDKKNPLISPVFADLHGLPPILIHVGSDELMLSTSQILHEKALKSGVDSHLFVGKEMWHNWHLFAGFVPEAKHAMKDVKEFITRSVL